MGYGRTNGRKPASRVAMELSSVPTEIDEVQRRLRQLELAARQLAKETEDSSLGFESPPTSAAHARGKQVIMRDGERSRKWYTCLS